MVLCFDKVKLISDLNPCETSLKYKLTIRKDLNDADFLADNHLESNFNSPMNSKWGALFKLCIP